MNIDHNPNYNVKTSFLIIIATITIISILATRIFTSRVRVDAYPQMINAANTMHSAINVIRNFRAEKNIGIDPLPDPNLTGFIGQEFSVITTTLGNIRAKQTAVNPDFAALMVRWISELKLQPGSDVIIHASASFPALTIMAIIASEILGMQPVIFSSLGASSYGANIPDFTYLDIENHLFQNKIIKHRSALITPGGNNDNGSSLWEGGWKIIERSVHLNNYQLTIPDSLSDTIYRKWHFCFEKYNPAVFINIGGNHSALGNGDGALDIPSGKILSPLHCSNGGTKGLIHQFSDAGIPVFHFLHIQELAVINGINLTPVPLPEPGKSNIYFRQERPVAVIVIAIIVILSSLFAQWLKKRSTKFLPFSKRYPPGVNEI